MKKLFSILMITFSMICCSGNTSHTNSSQHTKTNITEKKTIDIASVKRRVRKFCNSKTLSPLINKYINERIEFASVEFHSFKAVCDYVRISKKPLRFKYKVIITGPFDKLYEVLNYRDLGFAAVILYSFTKLAYYLAIKDVSIPTRSVYISMYLKLRDGSLEYRYTTSKVRQCIRKKIDPVVCKAYKLISIY